MSRRGSGGTHGVKKERRRVSDYVLGIVIVVILGSWAVFGTGAEGPRVWIDGAGIAFWVVVRTVEHLLDRRADRNRKRTA